MKRDIEPRKRIGLVAHDNKKQDLVEWARYNRAFLVEHDLIATGTTGTMLQRELGTEVTCLQSGPLGGDLQVGAMIAEGRIDFLVFFWDPLEPQPHDPDVKALLRIAVVWNIPVACDRASADFMISSPLMTGPYERQLPDYTEHLNRLMHIASGPASDLAAALTDAAEAIEDVKVAASLAIPGGLEAAATPRAGTVDPAPNPRAGALTPATSPTDAAETATQNAPISRRTSSISPRTT